MATSTLKEKVGWLRDHFLITSSHSIRSGRRDMLWGSGYERLPPDRTREANIFYDSIHPTEHQFLQGQTDHDDLLERPEEVALPSVPGIR